MVLLSLTNVNSLFGIGNFNVKEVVKLTQILDVQEFIEKKFDVIKFKEGITI